MNKREQMVEVMRGRYGLDAPAVFSAMLQVERDKFVDMKYRDISYSDRAIPIGHGQTMSQPYTVAFMTHLLVRARDRDISKWRVLEVGTGSGYQTAVLSLLVGEVYTIEIIHQLADRAKKRLKKLGYKNIKVREGSGEWGWKENAPYDAIIITAGITGGLPLDLVDQLKKGGVIVAPIGRGKDKTMMKFIKGKKGKLKKEKHGIFNFVPFISEAN